LGYPVSQAADITFCKANLVPLGEDQLPHMEVARRLVRRFNSLYKPVLVEPEALLSDCPRLIGTDGNAKMGKSFNNSIYLSDTDEEVITKVKSAVTDANRITMKDKGNPDVCVVYMYHTAFSRDECDNIANMCRNAGVGCVACKKKLSSSINLLLAPIRERRKYFEMRPDDVMEILKAGSEKVQGIARTTVDEVKEAMNIKYF
ncbi:MAG TPA: tryptophan--tRNA ligase, partial [Clostridia bacterium]|nr:tryptophan--tRNA ligase [Clostridia bacterium]